MTCVSCLLVFTNTNSNSTHIATSYEYDNVGLAVATFIVIYANYIHDNIFLNYCLVTILYLD